MVWRLVKHTDNFTFPRGECKEPTTLKWPAKSSSVWHIRMLRY